MDWEFGDHRPSFIGSADVFALSFQDSLVRESPLALATSYVQTLCDSTQDSDGDGVCDSRADQYSALQPRVQFASVPSEAGALQDASALVVQQVNGPSLDLLGAQVQLRYLLADGKFPLWLSLDHLHWLSAEIGSQSLNGTRVHAGGDILGSLNATASAPALPESRTRVSLDLQVAAHRFRLTGQLLGGVEDDRNGNSLGADARLRFTYSVDLPNRRSRFSFVLDNLTNESPPTSTGPLGYEPSLHSPAGLTAHFSLRHDFN